MTRITIALALMLSCHVACSSTTEASGPGAATTPPSTEAGAACGKAGRTGETSGSAQCGTCGAGQYCQTSASKSDLCIPGCTSDANCGEAEQCIRCGTETVGTCQSCSRDAKDACKTTPQPDAGPEDPCMRVAGQDFMCQAPLAKAYECFGQDPLQTGCQHTKMGSPTVFCCAK